mmetsp:Transcript_28696/g.72053  ORF Transcript_28696/g.72053 Transcript_28696/m.72053 type:complete len:516 (-) Transcript_28696:232-1779(-)
MEAVEATKAAANQAFKLHHFTEAERLYTEALTQLDAFLAAHAASPDSAADAAGSGASATSPMRTKAVLLSNRSFTRLRLEEYGFAISDAAEAIASDGSFVKAYYRRACAYFALGKYKEARKDFRHVTVAHPADADARSKYKECERRVKEEAFANAIDSEANRVLVSSTIDVHSIAVAEGYDGPTWPLPPRDGEELVKAMVEDVKRFLEAFKAQKKVHLKYAMAVMLAAKAIFDELPSVVDYEVEEGRVITVCGDTHGQFYDLMTIFERNGLPSAENPYLFNGDFVDRGSFSVEVIMTLLAFKVWDPQCMHLTRGNHESINMNKIYGFQGEVKAKYSDRTFTVFTELFQSLPLAYVLDGTGANGKRALVLHGGLFSKDGVKLDDLRKINRFTEPDSGLMSEMLWSDPQKEPGWGPSKRGIAVAFGPDVTKRFLDDNNLQLLVRSHEMKEDGYEVEADGRLITVFSAPNYCDQMGNKGAYIRFGPEMTPDIRQFDAVPHPDVKPMAYASNMGGMMGF